MNRPAFFAALAFSLIVPGHAGFTEAQNGASPAPAAEEITLTQGFVLPPVGAGGRSPVHVDPIEAALIAGTFAAPNDGDEVKTWRDESVAWQAAEADDEGWFERTELRGGYLHARLEAESDRVMMLRARGHSMVYVNSEPRGGDVYNYGYVSLPVKLKKGVNEFLFLVARGRVKARLTPAPAGPFLLESDLTLPTPVAGAQDGRYPAQITVANPTGRTVQVRVGGRGDTHVSVSGSPTLIPPMTVRKVPFTLDVAADIAKGEHEVDLGLEDSDSAALHTHRIKLDVVGPNDIRRVTFRSAIDGSIQYYAVNPARPHPEADDKPGIVLTLHGASVEAFGQARAYRAKSWCHIVAPTNRRPFGFDWEDWGRLDAIEVLEHAQATLENDPSKVWLTGHSMGGHGAWSVGSHFPDRFAAVAPSAGWESFWSYTGGGGHPERFSISSLLNRTANPSRTLLRKHNYKHQGIYILHGDADDNVPVRESRRMHDELKEFHTDLTYFEQPNAGHWWDNGHDEGTDCVDWQPMFDMFARRRLPGPNEVTHVDFTTVCPEHNSRCHWLWVHAQIEHLTPSRIQMRADPVRRRFVGSTENVSRFGLQPAEALRPGDTLTVEVDGHVLEDIPWPGGGTLYLTRFNDVWEVSDKNWELARKGPHRYGWFKNAFRNEFVYVYGTAGSDEETASNFNKARYDLETWSYRANGSFDIVKDTAFATGDYPGRNVILIGNADNNAAWEKVLQDCPIVVESERVEIGGRAEEGGDLGLLFIYPRAGSDSASVGAIGGTGARGVMLTRRVRTFVSGASFPDFILYGPEMLHSGTGGVRAGGYFNEDWSLDGAEVVWNKNNTKE